MRNAGMILADVPWVDVDPHTAEVVLEPARLAASHFDGVIERLPSTARPEPTVAPGRYPIAVWYFDSINLAADDMPLIDAVATVLEGLRWPLTDVNAATALVRTFEHTPFARRFFGSPRELIDQLRE